SERRVRFWRKTGEQIRGIMQVHPPETISPLPNQGQTNEAIMGIPDHTVEKLSDRDIPEESYAMCALLEEAHDINQAVIDEACRIVERLSDKWVAMRDRAEEADREAQRLNGGVGAANARAEAAERDYKALRELFDLNPSA